MIQQTLARPFVRRRAQITRMSSPWSYTSCPVYCIVWNGSRTALRLSSTLAHELKRR
jgi:hypothetical protein